MHYQPPPPPRDQALDAYTALLDGALGFTSTDGRAFTRVLSASRTGYQAFPVRSDRFRNWFTGLASGRLERTPSNRMWGSICRYLEGEAVRDPGCTGIPIQPRVALTQSGGIAIDLGSSEGEYVEITADSWHVASGEGGPLFEKSSSILDLPVPRQPAPEADPLHMLRRTLHIENPTAWARTLAWLLSAFRPAGPYPILVLRGPAECGKSCAAKILRTLMDPTSSPFNQLPRTATGLLHLARHNWILAFDHVTHLTPSIAAALCRLTSGAGLAYTEKGRTEPVQQWLRRPILMTVADDCELPSEIVSRALFADLTALTPETRLPEPDLVATVEPLLPQLLGAICTAMSKCLAAQPAVVATRTRHSTVVSWAAPAFPEIAAAIDAPNPPHPYVQSIVDLVAPLGSWTGTAATLHIATRRQSRLLDRHILALHDAGIQVTRRATKNARLIELVMSPAPGPSAQPVRSQSNPGQPITAPIPPVIVTPAAASPDVSIATPTSSAALTLTPPPARAPRAVVTMVFTPKMEAQNVDLKQTINLPKTDFSMKANLPQKEPRILERWETERLYHQIRDSRKGRPVYILHDGPPYANGRIHLGTAFNKILKDFIVKSKTMAGFDSPYVPGWDCHGLPIEIKVDNELGGRKAKMTAVAIRRECRKYAEKYVNIQRQDFKRLGVLGRWEDPYLTMSAHYQSVIAGAFVDFLDRGYVYKGLKPVHWCIKDRTALAEAEVEYADHTSPSIWVRFALTSDAAKIDPALAGRRVYGLIWTTTPWTIPANMAIAYHPKFAYAAVDVSGEIYIVAQELVKVTAEKLGWSNPRTIATFPGERLEGAVFKHPLFERESVGILADHVTLEQGTGAVHTAPGHGQEDYAIGQKYGIVTFCPVDASGRFYRAEGAPGHLPDDLIGKTVWEANPVVIEHLKAAGALLGLEKLQHSYPHCWRCHNPVIFRATEQWFIGMERNGFRQAALDAIKRVKWMPAWGEERISNMIAVRPDWCISRQRVWGVPIIVFYCDACREPVTDRKILDRIVQLFAEHTADVWYERAPAELLPEGHKCAKCGAAEFSKETDILDVWFDSGSSHLAVLNERFALPWPADVYLEGGDQYRGWFHSSLLVGTGLKGGAPYRACVLNGWVLDGEGKAMHKSLGNSIEPEEVIKEHGADLLRLWTASVEFNEDVRMSPVILTRLVDGYRKLRNTFRYLLGNISGFDAARDAVPAEEMLEIDQWILLRAEDLVARCRAWYENFEFHKVYHSVYAFCTVDLSAIYCDIVKDRLYCSAPNWRERRSAQTALYRLLDALVRLLAPLMSFTAEEAWTHMQRSGSVHLALFPEPAELSAGIGEDMRKRLPNWDRLMEVRDGVLKSLETARNEKLIGAGLEAQVQISANGDLLPLLQEYAAQLPELFVVSQVAWRGSPDLRTDVSRAAGTKCERCWKYTTDVGSDPRFPTVCARCARAVAEIVHA